MNEPELVPVFMPPLVALLLNAERTKGAPLTESETVDIRDQGACVMMPMEQAQALAQQRAYDDIDPEVVWAEWQRVRAELAQA